jgi:hypothetical protein
MDGLMHAGIRSLATCAMVMQNIVADLLDFENLDSGRLPVVESEVLLQTIADHARDTFGPLTVGRAVKLIVEPIPAELSRPFWIDARRIEQCLFNGTPSRPHARRAARPTRRAHRSRLHSSIPPSLSRESASSPGGARASSRPALPPCTSTHFPCPRTCARQACRMPSSSRPPAGR